MPPSTNALAAAGEPAPKPEPQLLKMLETAARYSESKKMANGSSIKSAEKFHAGGHSWRILYYPNGRLPGTTASISLYLQLDATNSGDEEDVEARLKFFVRGGCGLRFLSDQVTGTVSRTRNAVGFERFVTREDLEMSDCVSNDWLSIRCDVTVLGTRRSRPPSSSLETGVQEPAADRAPPSSDEAEMNPSAAKANEEASSLQYQPPVDDTAPSPSEPQKPSMAMSPVPESSPMVKSTLLGHHQEKHFINKDMLLPGLNTDLRRLLVTKEGADVDFEVGGNVFAAHRCILAARSPILKEDFYSPAKEEDTSYMRINDMESEEFEALLHYMYTDSLPEMNMEEFAAMAPSLLAAANRYDLKDLKVLVDNKLCLCTQFSVATVVPTLVLAEQYQCLKLKNLCLRFIASPENTREVMATGGAEHLAKTCPAVMRQLVMNILDKREEAPRKNHSIAT